MPPTVSLIGDVLVAVGLGIAMMVVVQNGYAAANVTVESGQTVVSTGLYRLVRHPMYSGNIVLMVGIPPALGSYWGLVFVLPGLVVLVLRIRDEEELLSRELSGYRDYESQVRTGCSPSVVTAKGGGFIPKLNPHALADGHYTAGADREAVPVFFQVDAHHFTRPDDDVLVQDRVPHHSAAADPGAGHQHAALDDGTVVDDDVRRQHRVAHRGS